MRATVRPGSRLFPSLIALATLVVAVGEGLRVASPEPARAAGGSVSGRVFVDFNMNGLRNEGDDLAVASDPGLAGVELKAYDSAGQLVGTTTTGGDGSYTLLVSGAASQQLRVEFSTPSGYEPSFVATGSNTENNSSVQFVTDGATGVDYAVERPGNYCQDNPDMITCFAPNGANGSAAPGDPGGLRFPSRMTPLEFDSSGSVSGWPVRAPSTPTYTTQDPDVVASLDKLGSVFGIGIDRDNNVFFGTYVKRHSKYGQAGATNTIYRRNLASGGAGDVETFLTLPGTLPAHAAANPSGISAPPYGTDGRRNVSSGAAYSDVWSKAGRVGLGDVDVSPDGKTLYAVDMNESAPLLYTVPLTGSGASVAPGEPASVEIPRPTPYDGSDCVGTWHPMGIGLQAGSDKILVGGVCGAETTVGGTLSGMPAACKTTDPNFDPAACTTATSPYGQLVGGRTVVHGYVLEYSGGSWSTVASIPFDQKRSASGTGETTYSPWSYQSGLWRAWTDAKLNNVEEGDDDPNAQTAWAAPQPMISNIEITDSGSLVLGIRDRWQDKRGGPESISYESTAAFDDPMAGLPVSGGDLVRLCPSGDGRFNVESGGNCGSEVGSDNPRMGSFALGYGGQTFYFNGFGASNSGPGISHATTALGSTATIPGSSAVWTTAYDVSAFSQQGVRALGRCPAGATNCAPDNGGIGSQKAGIDWGSDYGWSKGNGLADLEMLCDKAPVQVGNRLWIDSDKDGIQDPGEKVVAGVTVRLYDATGTLAGTAVTDSEGRYYFSSTLDKPAAGDGTSQGGGLTPDKAFTIKLDNPADYVEGAPLHGYSLTKKDAGTVNTINSKAGLSGSGAFGTESFPEITIAARKPGENNHTFDAGFVAGSDPGPGPGPDPGAAKSPRIAVAPGGCIKARSSRTVRLSVRNPNSAALGSRRVEFVIPKGFRVVGGSRGYFTRKGTVIWRNGTIAAGKTEKLYVRLKAAGMAGARSRLTVSASGAVGGESVRASRRTWARICAAPGFTG